MLLKLKKLMNTGDFSGDPEIRAKYGMLSGFAGIVLNVLLFAGKLTVALLSSSVSIIADAFNNLSDAASSAVTMIGFKISDKSPDPAHPFGHGRAEYVAGLIVSIFIIVMGLELGITSVRSLMEPEEISFSVATVVILVASVLVKMYMALYNFRYAKYFKSAAMKATGIDSLSDCVATTVVLACLIVSHYTSVELDSWAGLAVSVFIIYSGIIAAKETLEPLLGAAPDEGFVEKVEQIVLSHPLVLGMHDLVVHDYGPGRDMISVHVELPSDEEVFTAHDTIDAIEKELARQLGCQAVIHMDPVDTKNKDEIGNKVAVSCIARQVDKSITIHDFRETQEGDMSRLTFDILVPFNVKLKDEEIIQKISGMVEEKLRDHICTIHCDRYGTK